MTSPLTCWAISCAARMPGLIRPVAGALSTINGGLTGKEQAVIDGTFEIGALVSVTGLCAGPRSTSPGLRFPGCDDGAGDVFADIVAEDIGDPVDGKVMTSLLTLLLEPDAVATADEHRGDVVTHDAGVNLPHGSIIVPGGDMTAAIRSEHVGVEVDAHFVFCAHGQIVDGF